AALVSSETSGGMLARRLAIPIMIIPVAFGSLVTMGVHRGSVPLTFAVVLSTTLSIALLGRLIWSAGLRLRRMDLDHRASELQRQLLSERLRHADKMESLGRVSGGIAHDFNN